MEKEETTVWDMMDDLKAEELDLENVVKKRKKRNMTHLHLCNIEPINECTEKRGI